MRMVSRLFSVFVHLSTCLALGRPALARVVLLLYMMHMIGHDIKRNNAGNG